MEKVSRSMCSLSFCHFFEHISFNLSLFHTKQLLAGNTIVHKLIFYIIACAKVIASSNIEMWMSKEEMEAEYDYEKKDKVVQEEEESWGKLCSKLVSKILQS